MRPVMTNEYYTDKIGNIETVIVVANTELNN